MHLIKCIWGTLRAQWLYADTLELKLLQKGSGNFGLRKQITLQLENLISEHLYIIKLL